MKKVTAFRVEHKGEKRILLKFDYDSGVIKAIKSIPDIRWSSTLKGWHVPDKRDSIGTVFNALRGIAFFDYSELRKVEKDKSGDLVKTSEVIRESQMMSLSEEDEGSLLEFRRWMEHRRYSPSTISTYISLVSRFLRFIKPTAAGECSKEDIIRYVNGYIIPGGFSYSFQNQTINAIKAYFRETEQGLLDIDELERPRREHRLPNVLSKGEIKDILDSATNTKHRLMLSLIYGCGLRRGELLRLMLIDIDNRRKVVIIRQSKGKKDRIVPVSEKILGMLTEYVRGYKPERYLFEGNKVGSMYSATSLEKVLKTTCRKAGIRKPVSLHWLRHSYATHLLESGTDIRYIQVLLGHNSTRTTEIYTHVSMKSIENIKSPFDTL